MKKEKKKRFVAPHDAQMQKEPILPIRTYHQDLCSKSLCERIVGGNTSCLTAKGLICHISTSI
uniref:Uncharacterized protein n=1 Tax=Arundo donax TaxID=35708 RepID=A0A0A9HN28_ARUDO